VSHHKGALQGSVLYSTQSGGVSDGAIGAGVIHMILRGVRVQSGEAAGDDGRRGVVHAPSYSDARYELIQLTRYISSHEIAGLRSPVIWK
jgi:hypothetical protein